MTVIINELDVTVRQPEPSQGASSPGAAEANPSISPFELRSTLKHMSRRADRLRAD